MAKYATLVIVLVLYFWVIYSTMPYRREVITTQDMNNHFTRLERELAYTKSDYDRAMAKDPNSEETLQAGERLAITYWEKKNIDQAVVVIDDVSRKRRLASQNKYNEAFVSSVLIYAGILRDVANWTAAESYYQEVFAYDKKFLEKSDPNSQKIARDLNNLGLLFFLRATSELDPKVRSDYLKQSSDYLNQAIKMYQTKLGEGSPSEAISLWNLYFTEREQGNLKLANSLKQRAEAIDAKLDTKLNRPKAP